MKIRRVLNSNEKEFHQLTAGQVFELNQQIYMKLDQFNSHMTTYNAINLATTKFLHVSGTQVVELLPDAELRTK